MKQIGVIISFILVLSSFGCNNKTTSKTGTEMGEIHIISSEEMQSLLKMGQVQLVDVRTPQEFEGGYIENAQNIDFNSPTFDEDILNLDKEKPVILYCHSGGRSANCAKKMQQAGFKKIYDLEGGISRWKHKELPVVVD
ncbi:rhodanese-like domain-containing protein [Oceanihabitans sediminis]|uniref:Rhodanese-like domain-containing protein n=1 Tax=Oceanihabitans sediminis TaxID=1812012 RepID=A0A368P8G7_9FLAO|nr:rhodanese-like domain-containing protein [Oceanihabitans sediminis]MDX1278272.1 rhodanese-like domain-containing protein [Oceanihabitans sediminis]MDX1773745.1 rhodanese-like domain-containing protein [Oceanihabitans sediminis]RBP32230.1 rhodanese-related sulfurtransferase [Oceanihabitans sediminis]RCU58878.1 rhodanese-like domain-containing protein [Oceanihabitans sediminis]